MLRQPTPVGSLCKQHDFRTKTRAGEIDSVAHPSLLAAVYLAVAAPKKPSVPTPPSAPEQLKSQDIPTMSTAVQPRNSKQLIYPRGELCSRLTLVANLSSCTFADLQPKNHQRFQLETRELSIKDNWRTKVASSPVLKSLQNAPWLPTVKLLSQKLSAPLSYFTQSASSPFIATLLKDTQGDFSRWGGCFDLEEVLVATGSIEGEEHL